jgi:hypothetical protein
MEDKFKKYLNESITGTYDFVIKCRDRSELKQLMKTLDISVSDAPNNEMDYDDFDRILEYFGDSAIRNSDRNRSHGW